MVVASRCGLRRLAALALWVAASGAAAESPADNDRLRDLMTGYVVALDAGEILGLAPDLLISHTGESAALAAGLGLKFTAPVLKPPGAITRNPNTSDQCRFRYQVPQTQGTYQDWFGFWELDSLPSNWGPFGAPVVEHKDTTVSVNLVDSHRVDGGSPQQSYLGEMPEGYTQVTWEAHTQISDFWDIYFPSTTMLWGLGTEYRRAGGVAAKAAGASTSKAKKLFANLKKVAVNLGKAAAVRGAERVDDLTGSYFGDERTTVSNIGGQDVTIWDLHPPYFTAQVGSSPIAQQTITIEATDFGGARFSRATVRESLEAAFRPRDDCNRELSLNPQDPPSLLPVGDTGTDVVWTLQDAGPYEAARFEGQLAGNQELLRNSPGDDNALIRTTLTQRVIVADTQPPILAVPAGFARYADAPLTVGPGGVSLGAAQVVDRADPNPVVTNNAPATLGYGRHLIDYEAYDFTGNVTVAPADQPERYTQVVTVKAPDTNTEPEAFDTSAQTRTGLAVPIQLTAEDTDWIDERFDPLSFRITQRPEQGTFQTPPLPYFIEDFRPQPETVPDGTNADTLACLESEDRNSGPKLEAKLGLLDANQHDEYVEKCYCDLPSNMRDVPNDFVYAPEYVHIEDDGDYVVSDKPMECEDANNGGGVTGYLRFSRWRDDRLLGQHRLPASARGRVGPFDVDRLGRIWWNDLNNSTDTLVLQSLDENFEPWYRNGDRAPESTVLVVDRDSAPFINPSFIVYAHPDIDRGLIYVNDKNRVFVFAMVGNRDRAALGTLNEGAALLTPCAVNGKSLLGFTMTSDTDGALYVADSCANRIHQFAASTLDTQGALIAGDYVGWLGRCSANRNDPDRGVPFNHCDVQNKTSVGFACTDQTCDRDNLADRSSGTGPGQFDVITHLNLDPNDVLYVADFDNQRIQRFSAGGAFAGEAVSTGDGVTQDGNFVLGNMGPPLHVSVNGDSFHVLESLPSSSDYFLHIFKSLPFRDVTDNSAWVDYVSNPKFVGADTFAFLVDDGIDISPPATVGIQVDRNFRAPFQLQATCWSTFTGGNLGSAKPCVLNEDAEIYVQLTAQDPDGFVGFGGLDQHTFSIATDPVAGTLTELATDVNQAIYRYTPNADYNGADTFTFQAFDGVDNAAQPGTANLTIEPLLDNVDITFADQLRFPRGFPQALTARFADVDRDPTQDLEATSWDWGDGVIARDNSATPWLNIGIRDEQDQPVNPQIDGAPVEGLLLGAHTYNVSNNGVTICMLERNTDVVECTASPAIEVVEVTRVAMQRVDDRTIQPEQPEQVRFVVTNEQPKGWSGIAVNSAELAIALPVGVEVLGANAGCAGPTNGTLRCPVDLAVGEATILDLTLQFALSTARTSPFFSFELEMTGDTPRLEARNLQTLVVEASDRDSDGAIDADDAFPDDVRYQADSDGDGMADAWELRFGLDSGSPADAALDDDGDGFSNRLEFRYEGTPRLADVYLKAEQLRLNLGIQDQLGFATASADVNGDGFSDVIMTAPTVGTNGELLIALGGADGVAQTLARIDGPVSGFGRSVSAGDINSDGYADVVVGALDSVVLYLGRADGLSVAPDQVIRLPSVGFGTAVLLADIDADEVLDLLVTQPQADISASNAGGVLVYLGSSEFWQATIVQPNKSLNGASGDLQLGQSLATGDLDGDGLLELLVGSTADTGSVYGYLGSSFDWSTPTHGAADFVLLGEAASDRFGFSLASGADVDGDGRHDLVVGAYRAGSAGAAYVFSSASTLWTGSPVATQRLDGEQASEQFGVRVGLLAPRGARTTADILVGANRGEQGSEPDEGSMYLYEGGALPLSLTRVDRGPAHDMLGYYLQGTQDLNGDGRADALASAPDISVSGWVGDGGFVQVYYGGGALAQIDQDDDGVADTLDSCPATANTDQADLDGDGMGDVCDPDADGDGVADSDDNCPRHPNADQANLDNDSLGDLCDNDDDNDGTEDTEDAFPRDERYQSDSDGDGLPDRFEQEAGLDANNSADATQDLDGDGRNNLAEFQQGGDVAADDVPPILVVPDTVRVNAVGPYTRVALGNAVANDAKNGTIVATNDAPSAFRSGLHTVTWRAADAADNEVVAQQRVEVIPLLEVVGIEQGAVEGQRVQVAFELSGEPIAYPVQADIVFGGDADQGADFTSASSTLTISAGLRGQLALDLIDDGVPENDERVSVVLDRVTNAVAGPNQQLDIVITEGDVAPRLALRLEQTGKPISIGYRSNGSISMYMDIDDANAGATHAIDWSATESALVPAEGPFTASFTFDPMMVNPGLYQVAVTVVDSDNPTQPYAIEQLLRIEDQPPMLTNTNDTDSDGIGDQDDGLADVDQDGLSDYRDATQVTRWLATQDDGPALLQSEPGTSVRVGATAYAAAKASRVLLGDVASFGDRGRPAANVEDGYRFPGGIFDFVVTSVQPGRSTYVVLPQQMAIPANASYRKYNAQSGWATMVEDAANQVFSAPGDPSVCPAPGSAVYRPGLNRGDHCVQLRLQDGGPNDSDGAPNGRVVDPGGVAILANVTPTVVAAGNQPPDTNADVGQNNVPLLRFSLQADSTTTVLREVSLEASGTGADDTAVVAVKLWHDRNGDGSWDGSDVELGTGTYPQDNGTLLLTLTTPLTLPVGQTNFMVTYDF